jgi:hypothetical protein
MTKKRAEARADDHSEPEEPQKAIAVIPQYELALTVMKSSQFRPTSLLILNNSTIMKMVATWPLVRREQVEGFNFAPGQNTAWDAVRYSDHEWARKAGISTQEVRTYDSTLIAHSLIFPDGSIPKEVNAILNRQVKAMLGAKDE